VVLSTNFHHQSRSPRLQQALGLEYATQEKYDLALASLQASARSDPKMPGTSSGHGAHLLEQKKFDDALTEINLELNLVPESQVAAAAKRRSTPPGQPHYLERLLLQSKSLCGEHPSSSPTARFWRLPAATPIGARARPAARKSPPHERDAWIYPACSLAPCATRTRRRIPSAGYTYRVHSCRMKPKGPKSIRTCKTPVMVGEFSFLTVTFRIAVIAWKSGSDSSLDDSGVSLWQWHTVKLNHRDWRARTDKLATAQPPRSAYLYWLARLI